MSDMIQFLLVSVIVSVTFTVIVNLTLACDPRGISEFLQCQSSLLHALSLS